RVTRPRGRRRRAVVPGGRASGSRHPGTRPRFGHSRARGIAMAVENWPKIAERIALQHGGKPFTRKIPGDKWCYRVVAWDAATTRDVSIELGDFAFPTRPGLSFSRDVMAAITAHDGRTEAMMIPLGRPTE